MFWTSFCRLISHVSDQVFPRVAFCCCSHLSFRVLVKEISNRERWDRLLYLSCLASPQRERCLIQILMLIRTNKKKNKSLTVSRSHGGRTFDAMKLERRDEETHCVKRHRWGWRDPGEKSEWGAHNHKRGKTHEGKKWSNTRKRSVWQHKTDDGLKFKTESEQGEHMTARPVLLIIGAEWNKQGWVWICGGASLWKTVSAEREILCLICNDQDRDCERPEVPNRTKQDAYY